MMLPIPNAKVVVRSAGITSILRALTFIVSRWRRW
jgi:hypothetical protein